MILRPVPVKLEIFQDQLWKRLNRGESTVCQFHSRQILSDSLIAFPAFPRIIKCVSKNICFRLDSSLLSHAHFLCKFMFPMDAVLNF